MKLLAIGDPHGDLKKIRKIPMVGIDLILVTGDLGSANLAREMAFGNIKRKKDGLDEIEYAPSQRKKAFMEAYDSTIKVFKYLTRFAPVYTIFGNVESSNKDTKRLSKKIGFDLPLLYDDLNSLSGVRVINNRVANFNGVRIGGLEYFVDTNWVQEFKPSKYRKKLIHANVGTKKAKKTLEWFDSLDILVCHQPPYGILDKVTAKFAPKDWQGKNAGSKTILNYIRRKKPQFVFCGHIHEGEGFAKIGKTEVYNLGVAGHKIIEV